MGKVMKYNMTTIKRAWFTWSLILFLTALQGRAADPNTFKSNWLERKANKEGPDFIQHEKAGPGWFSNLGPTGIRALMTDKEGKTEWKGIGSQFVVKYVFPKSPASIKVQVGDIIIGVNGKRFETPYNFGYWFGWGYEGPLTDFGKAVEEAEAKKKGMLDILLIRKGKEMTVSVKLPLQEALAPTWPYNCKKSEKLKNDAIAWIIKHQESGRWPGTAVHAEVFSCLALMAQGKTYLKQVKAHLDTQVDKFNDRTWNWQLTMYAILMSEYQLATGTKTYQKTLRQINDLLKKNQRFANSTLGHEGNAGEDGYGPMSGISGLTCLAWAMMEKAGIDIHKDAYEKTLITMDMELVRKDGDSPQGDYGYGWPNKGVLVYDFKPKEVLPSLNHLKVDIKTFNDARAAGIPKGAMALVHSIRPWQDYSPQVAKHHVNKICRTRRCLVNGHGSGMLHAWMCFLALGYTSNTGYPDPLRLTLDTNRDLMMSARCPDGSFYAQPQRDDMGGDLGYGSRTLPTALWATVLSIPDAKLVMLGREQSEKAQKVWKSATQKIRMRQYAAAIPLLLEAKEYGVVGAQEQLDEIKKLADAAADKGMKYVEAKNVSAATSHFKTVIRTYGEEMASKAVTELDKLENDPATLKEKAAEKQFLTIRKNYKIAGKEKTKAALNKLITDYPGTTAAKQAEATIKKMAQ